MTECPMTELQRTEVATRSKQQLNDGTWNRRDYYEQSRQHCCKLIVEV